MIGAVRGYEVIIVIAPKASPSVVNFSFRTRQHRCKGPCSGAEFHSRYSQPRRLKIA